MFAGGRVVRKILCIVLAGLLMASCKGNISSPEGSYSPTILPVLPKKMTQGLRPKPIIEYTKESNGVCFAYVRSKISSNDAVYSISKVNCMEAGL